MPEISPELRVHRQHLRIDMRARRAALAAHVRIEAGQGIAMQLARLSVFSQARRLAGYFACDGELPLHEVPALCSRSGMDYYLPVLGRGRIMRFARWQTGEALGSNRYGIPEPRVPEADLRAARTLDVVLAPVIAFSRDGTRLGTGGGFYDATFAFLRRQPRPARPRLCGVAYSVQEVGAGHPGLQAQDWDVPLDFVLTERETIVCAQGEPCNTV